MDQLIRLAGTGIGSDERPVTAVRVNYNGTATPRRATLRAEMASMESDLGIDGPNSGAEVDPDSLVAFPAASQMAVLATDKRLILWSLGFTGKPQALLGIVPDRGLAEVHHGEVRFGPIVRVVMKSGATVDLEVRKGDDVDAFVSALQTLVSQAPVDKATSSQPALVAPDVDGLNTGESDLLDDPSDD